MTPSRFPPVLPLWQRYAGSQNTCNNLFWTADNKIVYYLAALGIVYDPVSHTQVFYEVGQASVACMGHLNAIGNEGGHLLQHILP